MVRRVVWDTLARNSFRSAHKYIKKDSPVQAERFRVEILDTISKLVRSPEHYPPDKYKVDRDVRYRAVEKFNYRISYFVSESEVRILRFRHVRRLPESY